MGQPRATQLGAQLLKSTGEQAADGAVRAVRRMPEEASDELPHLQRTKAMAISVAARRTDHHHREMEVALPDCLVRQGFRMSASISLPNLLNITDQVLLLRLLL